MKPGRTAPFAVVAAVLVLPPSAMAVDSGVKADPGSGAGSVYALPLASARDQSSGGKGVSSGSGSSRREHSSPSFGAGVSSGGSGGSGGGTGGSGGGTPGSGSGTSGQTSGGTASHASARRNATTSPSSNTGPSPRAVSGADLARAEHQSGFPGPVAIGLIVGVLVAGSLVAMLLVSRRRGLRPEGQAGPPA